MGGHAGHCPPVFRCDSPSPANCFSQAPLPTGFLLGWTNGKCWQESGWWGSRGISPHPCLLGWGWQGWSFSQHRTQSLVCLAPIEPPTPLWLSPAGDSGRDSNRLWAMASWPLLQPWSSARTGSPPHLLLAFQLFPLLCNQVPVLNLLCLKYLEWFLSFGQALAFTAGIQDLPSPRIPSLFSKPRVFILEGEVRPRGPVTGDWMGGSSSF